MNDNKKLFVFHGCDRKVGTTMVSHSFAKYLAEEMGEGKVLFVAINGNDDVHYCPGCKSSLDLIKMRIDNNLLTAEELKNSCDLDKDLYVLCGVSGISIHRNYSVEFPSKLFKIAFEIFDIIIADAGNELDSGLCIGALKSGGIPVMVLNQNEICLRRIEIASKVYKSIGVEFNHYLVNKYYSQDPHDISYLRKRLDTGLKDRFFKIREERDYSRIAEIDEQLIISYKCSGYRDDIKEFMRIIMKYSGIKDDIPVNPGKKKIFNLF